MDKIGYEQLIEQAMLEVVRSILEKVEKEGLQGDHHFYITFLTRHPKVKLSQFLLEKYPQQITIVVQHQFWNLQVQDKGFEIELRFGVRQKLFVPFDALLSFSDPSVQFSLHFKNTLPFEDTIVASEDTIAPETPSPSDKIIDFSHFKNYHKKPAEKEEKNDE